MIVDNEKIWSKEERNLHSYDLRCHTTHQHTMIQGGISFIIFGECGLS